MIRRHENSDAWKAGMYAIAVHAVLLAGMLFSFNWKAAHPVLNVTEVELWDKLPSTQPPHIIEPPKPIIEEQPKPIVEEPPKPVIEEPKPEEPKVDIELENKKKELEKKELEKKKKLETLQAELRNDDMNDKKADEKKQKDALKKLQQDALSDENAASDKQASAADEGVIGEYTEKIKAKIRGNVNTVLCGDGNPVLKVSIGILPTGQLKGGVKITKSSGNSTCDEAVERAILASEPFQLPEDAKLKAEFRDLNLTLKPNN